MIRFRQGVRWFLQGATIAEVEKATNRPLLEDHVKAISKYLTENVTSAYILLSVNIHTSRPLRFYTTNTDEVITFGYLFLPQTASYSITDGQHRVEAARRVVEQFPQELRDRFSEDGIPVMVSLESDVKQLNKRIRISLIALAFARCRQHCWQPMIVAILETECFWS